MLATILPNKSFRRTQKNLVCITSIPVVIIPAAPMLEAQIKAYDKRQSGHATIETAIGKRPENALAALLFEKRGSDAGRIGLLVMDEMIGVYFPQAQTLPESVVLSND